MRALVLGGAGSVCKETIRDLAEYSDFAEIVVADYNVAAAQALVGELDDPRLQVIRFNADDYEGMLRLFPDFDVVVNGLPFQYDYPVNKACVEVGVNGLDLSSDDPSSPSTRRRWRRTCCSPPAWGPPLGKGVLPPEQAFPTVPFFAELAR